MIAPPRDVPLADVFANPSPVFDPVSGLSDLLGAVLAARPPWMRDALCVEYQDVSFFPGRGDDVRLAKQVCAECLVKAECREWALAQGPDLDGIWAGTSARQRKQMRAEVPAELRQRRRPRRQVPTLAQQERKARPTTVMERVSRFLVTRDHVEHRVVWKSVTGDSHAIDRALLALADEGYITLTVGGIDRRGRHSPKMRIYRYVRPYTEAADAAAGGGPEAEATGPPGRSTAA